MTLEHFFFVEVENQVIELKLYERLFILKRIPLFYNFNGHMIPSYRSLDIWIDTGEALNIEPDNIPLLPKCKPELQLYVIRGDNTLPNNTELLNLYYEGVMTNNYQLEGNIMTLIIADFGKWYNYIWEEEFNNRWKIFDKDRSDSLESTLNNLLRRES